MPEGILNPRLLGVYFFRSISSFSGAKFNQLLLQSIADKIALTDKVRAPGWQLALQWHALAVTPLAGAGAGVLHGSPVTRRAGRWCGNSLHTVLEHWKQVKIPGSYMIRHLPPVRSNRRSVTSSSSQGFIYKNEFSGSRDVTFAVCCWVYSAW